MVSAIIKWLTDRINDMEAAALFTIDWLDGNY